MSLKTDLQKPLDSRCDTIERSVEGKCNSLSTCKRLVAASD